MLLHWGNLITHVGGSLARKVQIGTDWALVGASDDDEHVFLTHSAAH
jgi:hypothetical protein